MELEEQVISVIKEKNLETKTVYVFGTVQPQNILKNILYLNGMRVEAFLDNNQFKKDTMLFDTPVIGPEKMEVRDNSFVFVYSSYVSEMVSQLKSLGLTDEQIAVIPFYMNKVTGWNNSFSDDGFAIALDSVKKGEEIYHRLKREGELSLLEPTHSLGDLYMVMPFLHHFLEREGIDKYRLVLSGRGDMFFPVFDEIPYEKISIQEKEDLLRYVSVMGEKELGVFVIYPYLPFWKDYFNLPGKAGSQVAHREARYTFAISDLNDAYRAPMFPQIDEEEFISKGLVKGKSVVFTPRGQTVFELPFPFWEELAERLKKQGFSVFTSVVGNEKPIRGTEGIFIDMIELPEYLNYAGYYIGLRSGINDIAIRAKEAKEWVLYTRTITVNGGTISYKESDSVDNDFLVADLVEMECRYDEDYHHIIDEIMEGIEKK